MYDLRNIHMFTDNTFSIYLSINNRPPVLITHFNTTKSNYHGSSLHPAMVNQVFTELQQAKFSVTGRGGCEIFEYGPILLPADFYSEMGNEGQVRLKFTCRLSGGAVEKFSFTFVVTKEEFDKALSEHNSKINQNKIIDTKQIPDIISALQELAILNGEGKGECVTDITFDSSGTMIVNLSRGGTRECESTVSLVVVVSDLHNQNKHANLTT